MSSVILGDKSAQLGDLPLFLFHRLFDRVQSFEMVISFSCDWTKLVT